jgi:16S rRNA (guanine966-N2)-methyltransferase
MSRLRIISGEFGGRLISADVGRATHPMGDRVRSALFNMIDVDGATVLDAYAGTGAVGLEALSRGALRADFVENNKQAQRVIAGNIAALGVADRTKLYKMSLNSFLNQENPPKYDVIFADPPYDLLAKEFSTVFQLKDVVKNNGLMILSYSGRLCVPTVNGVVVVDNRKYGDAGLAIFRFM